LKNATTHIATMSDEAVITAYVKTGEMNLVGELYNRYAHLVFGVALKYLKNKDESKDVMIQVFEKLLVDLKKYEILNFKSWLYTYTKNACLMAMRKREIKLSEKDAFDLPVKAAEESYADDVEMKLHQLEVEVEKLNADQKICIRLFYLENKSYTQIMSETGFTFNQIKSSIQNGKRNLKIRLSGTNE